MVPSASPDHPTRRGETPGGEPSTSAEPHAVHAEGRRNLHGCWDVQGRHCRRSLQRGESSNTVRLCCWMWRSRICARLSMVWSRGLSPSAPPWLSQSSWSRRRDSSSRPCHLPDRSRATAAAGKLQERSRRDREERACPGKAEQRAREQQGKLEHTQVSRGNAHLPRERQDEEPST